MNDRDRRIIEVIRSLREGEVVSYGDIAADAGYPTLSRLVGRLLAETDDEKREQRILAERVEAHEVFAPAREEVVDDDHRVARAEERLGEVRTHEAGAPGDDDAHGRHAVRTPMPW